MTSVLSPGVFLIDPDPQLLVEGMASGPKIIDIPGAGQALQWHLLSQGADPVLWRVSLDAQGEAASEPAPVPAGDRFADPTVKSARLATGDVVVAWLEPDQTGSAAVMRVQVFDPSGTARGPASTEALHGSSRSVSRIETLEGLADGGFVAVTVERVYDGWDPNMDAPTYLAQRFIRPFDADGTGQTPYTVRSSIISHSDFKLLALPDGGFVFARSDYNRDDDAWSSALRFGPDGADPIPLGSQRVTALHDLGDDRLLVMWDSSRPFTDGNDRGSSIIDGGGNVIGEFTTRPEGQVVALPGGGFVILATEDRDGVQTLVAEHRDPMGERLGEPLVLGPSFGRNFTMLAGEDGGLTLYWAQQYPETADVRLVSLDLAPNTPAEGSLTIEGTAAIGAKLTLRADLGDPDGFDPADVTIKWLRDGEVIPDLSGWDVVDRDPYRDTTGWTLPLEAEDLGHRISARISFDDAGGAQETVLSDPTDVVILSPFTGTDAGDNMTGTILDDTLSGEAGNDTVRGYHGNDLLFGGTGHDILAGNLGDDTVFGGPGNDTLHASMGADHLYGDAGEDLLYGGAGDDTLRGGAGDDLVHGWSGNDILAGNIGDDTLHGGDGRDVLHGGNDDDHLFGDNGADTLFGGAGHDTIRGGAEADALHGGEGNDVLAGNEGEDRLSGGAGQDLLFGGAGHDDLNGDDARDRLFGGLGDDTLRGGDDNDRLSGDAGNDILAGNEGDDILRGGGGDDTGFGGSGDDVVFGDAGDDLISGNLGHDTLRGGSGDDLLHGDRGDDILAGNAGMDRLDGGAGRDSLFGGADNDALAGGHGQDMLDGGSGDDTLTGGTGRDLLRGGDGADVFVWLDPTESPHGLGRDTIADFVPGQDLIDLSALHPDLTFVSAYTRSPGEVRYNDDIGRLYVDLVGNGASDVSIDLLGAPGLGENDLVF